MKSLKRTLLGSAILSAAVSFSASASGPDVFSNPLGPNALPIDVASAHKWCQDKGYAWGSPQSYTIVDGSYPYGSPYNYEYNGGWGAGYSTGQPYYGGVPIVDVVECFK